MVLLKRYVLSGEANITMWRKVDFVTVHGRNYVRTFICTECGSIVELSYLVAGVLSIMNIFCAQATAYRYGW